MAQKNAETKTTEQVVEEVLTEQKENVKPTIERDVRLRVCIVGAGNAGNQAIIHANREGMKVFAVNSSIKDLSDEIVDETISSFIIGNEARGAGKNRAKAEALFQENGKELFNNKRFMDMIQESDIVFVVGATGGGTGSYVAPRICDILTRLFPHKIVIFYGITPKNSDTLTAMNNTLQCINDVLDLKIPYLIDDLSYWEDQSNDVAFDAVGRHVVENIKVIAGHYLNISKFQMIDENDMKTIAKEPGYMGIYMLSNINSSMLQTKSMQEMMIEKIKNSPAMAIQKDGIVKQMGVILNCPDDMYEQTRTGNYSQIYDYLGGKPRGLFENYASCNGTTAQMILILSGMTMPHNRISVYSKMLEEDAENQKRIKEINLKNEIENFSFLANDPNMDKLSSNTTTDQKALNSMLDDIFG